ncbi:acyltransferase [Microbacterium sp.]|uniref:acyltransferase family protein n=1 Tax=Microbacterium sp. TaxID=51671 RepID=UPI002617DEDE|nr:acyltransferase [Microbacterium sp.]
MATGGPGSTRVRAIDIGRRRRDGWTPLGNFDGKPSEPRPLGRSFVLLDGLRGVAAIAVAVLHMSLLFPVALYLPVAHLAVDFFLQLSGFIVAHAYGARITAGMSFRDFARVRVGRLYPAYALGFVIGIAAALVALRAPNGSLGVFPWTPETLACGVVPQALMIPPVWCSWGVIYPLNSPMWSILYELIFSFAFFALAAHLLRWQRAVASAIIMLGLITVLITGTLAVGPQNAEFIAGFVRLGFSFLVSVAIYGLGVTVRRTSNLVALALPVLLAVVILVPIEGFAYELGMIVIVFPAIIVVGASFNPANPRIAWAMLQLGALSYLLYAIHMPIFQIVRGAISETFPGYLTDGGEWVAVLVIALVVPLSWALARTYEPAARRLFMRATARSADMTKSPSRTA